jgi:hypothetical protein
VPDLLWGEPWRSIAELHYDKLVTERTNFSAQARQHVKHFLRVVENVPVVSSLLFSSDFYRFLITYLKANAKTMQDNEKYNCQKGSEKNTYYWP